MDRKAYLLKADGIILATEQVTRQLISRSPEETRTIGKALGRCLQPGDVLLLQGPFGAGKTCLAQGIASGLGVVDYVKSPSFTLINEHRTQEGHPLYHIDLYRIGAPDEAHSFGMEDYLGGDGVCIIEWSERADSIMPLTNLRIIFSISEDDNRLLTLVGNGTRYRKLVESPECF